MNKASEVTYSGSLLSTLGARWYRVKTVLNKLFRYLLTPFIPGKKLNPDFYTMKSRNARHGMLFILPFILGFLVFMVRPLFSSLMLSFSNVTVVKGKGLQTAFSGFYNYYYAMRVDNDYATRLGDEVLRMLINSFATLVLSFVIAFILNQEFKGRTAARVIFFLPVILASGVLSGIDSNTESYNLMMGMSADVVEASGVNLSASLQNLLSTSGIGSEVFDVVFDMIDAIYDIIMASGIQIIVFLSGLQNIPRSLYEAADVEGCTAWESFCKITFPMVSPLLLVNGIYTIIDFFMKDDNRIMDSINDYMITKIAYGVSSAMSWIYFGVTIAFIGVFSFIVTRGVHYYED